MRIAMISMHTSPIEQPGSGDAGGMNVYVLEVAKHLAKRGTGVEIFTQSPAGLFQPPVHLFDRQPDRPHHQREAHDRAGQGRAGPAEGELDTGGAQHTSDRALAAERHQQQVADHVHRPRLHHLAQVQADIDALLPSLLEACRG